MGFEILKNLLIKFVSAVPNILAAIFISLVGFVIAKSVGKLITHLFQKIGVDKLADKLNEIDVVNKYNIQFKPSRILGEIIYYFMMLFFLIAATELLGMPAVSNLISDLINYIPNLVVAGIVLVIGLVVSNALKEIVNTTCKSLNVPNVSLIGNLVFYFVFITIALSALSQAKIDTSFIRNNLSIILGGIVAAFSIGYGLASKDMMSNFLASFYSRRHIQVGDNIKIGDVAGTVIYTDSTCMKIQSGEKMVIIPMNKLSTHDVEIMPGNREQLNQK